jgi:VanZ family protein
MLFLWNLDFGLFFPLHPTLYTLLYRSLFMVDGQRGSAVSASWSSSLKMWLPPCGFAALILLLSSTPGSYFPEHPNFLNNAIHFMEFGVLAFLLSRTLHYGHSLSRTSLFLWTTLICVSFGLLDEAHQFMVPERVFGLADLVFDTLGAAVGSAVFIISSTFKAENPHKSPAASGDMND